MGSRQRRAAKIHESNGTPQVDAKARRFARAQDAASAAGSLASHFGKFPKWLANVLTAVVCLAVALAFLYTPAAQCYAQMRERDRLSAEYAAVVARNEVLQQSVDSLQSETGIEDRATEQFGMVKSGENAVSVSGLESTNDTQTFTSTITPGSIEAPDTWYSGVFDAIFGYEK
jgi:cell division protein FtsB